MRISFEDEDGDYRSPNASEEIAANEINSIVETYRSDILESIAQLNRKMGTIKLRDKLQELERDA